MSVVESQQDDVQSTPPGNDDELPELPFVTTSDVMNQLNKNLKELAANDPDASLMGLSPHFELQKRLPNGSSIPASESDLAYSDLKTKIEQSAKFVASLESDSERARWAEAQRHVGNSYFRKAEYPAAMDIYLTCLVVKQETLEFLKQTLLPILNNLAQCTLQLGMHKKTMEFCQIALDELSKYPIMMEEDNLTLEDRIAKCKIYFKRAKARRLTGSYESAREDLNQASSCLPSNDSSRNTNSNDSLLLAPYGQAIQKEFRLVESSEKEARKNRQRQKRAMQKVLQQQQSHTTKDGESSTDASLHDSALDEPKSPRKYSTLRARKTSSSTMPHSDASVEDTRNTERGEQLSYIQYYCLVVARVAEALLIWLGDEETKKKVKERLE